MTTNKNDANLAAVLSAGATLRVALENESNTAATGRALDQCHRLEQAIAQCHAEGLRFAAFNALTNRAKHWYDFYRTCPLRDTYPEKRPGASRVPH